MRIKLVDIDSTIPNLALMKLSHYYKHNGCDVTIAKDLKQSLFTQESDLIYGSAVFNFETTRRKIKQLKNMSDIVIGGTGSGNLETVENAINIENYEHYDYSIYPNYKFSIGYTQRGCRFNCKFCVVPKKEGKNVSINSIYDIWRKDTDKKIRLIDNDFFGQSVWKDRCKEIIEGRFQVCIDQGINFRIITDEQIEYLKDMDTRNHTFKSKCIYTAWDNLKHEKLFLEGLDRVLSKIKRSIVVLVLIGFVQETNQEIEYRLQQLIDRNVVPYPMIYNNKDNNDYKRLRLFRNWVLTRACWKITFDEFLKQGGDTIQKELNKNSLF